MTMIWHNQVRNLMIGAGLKNGFAATAAVSIYSGTQPTALEIINNWTNYKTAVAGAATTFTSQTSNLPQNADWSATTFWSSVAQGNGVFVAIANNSIGLATSPDGITWTSRSMPVRTAWSNVIFENGLFVAIAANTNISATSPDGITWTQRTLPAIAEWSDIIFGAGVYLIIANNSDMAVTSPDGITWTQRTLPVTAEWIAVAYGNSTFVVIANNSTMIATSADGITWIQRVAPVKLFWRDIAFGNGIFITIAYDSNLGAYSTDGINWTQTLLPSLSYWSKIGYGNGGFLAVSKTSAIAATTLDGATWVARALPVNFSWGSMVYGNGVFVVINDTTGFSTAVTITTISGASVPYLMAHYVGATWSNPLNGLLLQIGIPPAIAAINTGIGTWAILWDINVTRLQMDGAALPSSKFIVVPVSNDTGPGVIRFADTSFVAGASKVMSDGSLDAMMIS